MKDALRDRVITEKKDVAPGHVSAGFRHTGAHVSRQTFLANELSKKKKSISLLKFAAIHLPNRVKQLYIVCGICSASSLCSVYLITPSLVSPTPCPQEQPGCPR